MSSDDRYRLAYQSGLAFLNPHAPDVVLLRMASKHLQRRARVLEIGCGEGFEAAALSSMGFEVTALDASPSAIYRARETHSSSGVKFIVGLWPNCAATLEKGYDLVVDIGSLHTISSQAKRRAYLAGVAEVSKPKGWFFLRVGTDTRPERSRHPAVYKRKRPPPIPVWWELPNGETIVLPPPKRGWRPTPDELQYELKSVGFAIQRLFITSGITYPSEIVVWAKAP